ncbi:type I addiction module toxin, SymE family [Erwinia psidii]|uniref:SymE family type I addiction module toxin n=1 Tax=Erwinia psidii TaxID=69224 RepID=UPI00226B0EB4|nr:SymE family type I addiction module toxin [Erwinia psidii]MCX8962644.1 type I addiction module toxin, SymE family [Erwinia psidii]
MAEHDTKPEVSISKGLRQLKVGYTSIRHADRNDMTTCYSRCPSINLRGNWLQEAGFETDTPVDVRVMKDCLVITTKPKSPQIPLTREMLNRTEALPDKARQELCTLVSVLLIREGLGKVAPGE